MIVLLSLYCTPAGASDLVADTFTLTPPKIEEYFGMSRGHIHHVQNTLGFSERFPYATPIQVRSAGRMPLPRRAPAVQLWQARRAWRVLHAAA